MALQQRDDRVFNSWRKVLHSGRRQKVNVPGPIAWASLVRHGPNFKPVCEPAIFSPSGIGTVSGDGSAGHSPPGRYTFVDFPGEIRNLIYRLSLHYPDSFDLYYAYNQRIDEFYRRKMRGSNERFPRYEQVMRTPTILLLCKAITREALPILHASTLVIDRIPPWPPMAPHPLMVSQFIGRRTLQNIKKLEIRVSFGDGRFGSGWAWNKILVDLLSVLIERNSFTDMKIMIKLCDLENTDLWESEFSEYMALMRTVHLWHPA